ncbi:MAG: aconitate hydratase, partial [Dehalococcoidia bacterium]|nr:aconitate hydratase [Dehalococcoidia bacterium]
MPVIDSTPEFVANAYTIMRNNLEIVRPRLGRPLGLADKLVLSHLDDPENQELEAGKSYLLARPDRVILQDVLGQTAMLVFMQTRRASTAVPTSVHCDHLIQARVGASSDLNESVSENGEVYDFLRSAAAKFGVGFWGPGAGILHQVNLEQYAFPGAMIIGTDSHTPNAGGLGACSVGVGGADAVEVMAGLPWEVLYPSRIGVKLTGRLNGWTAPKDIILYLAGELTVSGATNAIIEYFGPGTETISCTGKATITNMGAELGATTSVFPYDESMARYLRSTHRAELADLADQNREMFRADQEVLDNPEAHFDRVVEIDLSKLEPHLVGPHSPDRARPISELAAQVKDPANGFIDEISTALIGSCTNSSYEDMSRSADVAEQAKAFGIEIATQLMVTPGSEQVRATIERDGQLESLRSIGATVLANACGPCIGQWRRARENEDANTIVTSYNRNFPARNDARPQTMNFIASPEMTVALALAGRLSFNPMTDTLTDAQGNAVMLEPPKQAPDVPEEDFDPGNSSYIAPPENGSSVEVVVDPNSPRIELINPWPAWDQKDIVDAPVVMKVQGKCTPDHISPAGPWLSLRGHLTKFSENFLMGGINAYNGEAGKGLDVLSGETGVAVSHLARHYQAEGLKWVVVGDSNYGEVSSREHAALSPKLLGGGAV